MKHVFRNLLIVAVLLVAVSSVGVAADKTVAFIRNYALTPESDSLVVTELQKLGFKVTEYDHAQIGDLKPGNYTLVMISSTVNSGSVATGCPAIFTAATPVINWEPGLVDELKIASATANGNGTNIVISGQHPIIAGLQGDTQITTVGGVIMGGGGTLAKGTQVLATNGKGNVLMAADKGAALLDGSAAPSRRVFLSASDVFMVSATDAVKTIFKQAVAWAIGQ